VFSDFAFYYSILFIYLSVRSLIYIENLTTLHSTLP